MWEKIAEIVAKNIVFIVVEIVFGIVTLTAMELDHPYFLMIFSTYATISSVLTGSNFYVRHKEEKWKYLMSLKDKVNHD